MYLATKPALGNIASSWYILFTPSRASIMVMWLVWRLSVYLDSCESWVSTRWALCASNSLAILNLIIRSRKIYVLPLDSLRTLRTLRTLERITEDDLNNFSNKRFCLFRENCCLFWGPGDHLNERLLSCFENIPQTKWRSLYHCKLMLT